MPNTDLPSPLQVQRWKCYLCGDEFISKASAILCLAACRERLPPKGKRTTEGQGSSPPAGSNGAHKAASMSDT